MTETQEMTVIERAAEAAAEAMNDLGIDASFRRKDGLSVARAVLQAIREPSEAMVRAGADSVRGGPSMGRSPLAEREASRHYQAMIDAALSE